MTDSVKDFAELSAVFNRWEKPDIRIIDENQQFSSEPTQMHRHEGFELRLFFSAEDHAVPEFMELILPKVVHRQLYKSDWYRTSSLMFSPLIYRNKSTDNQEVSSPFAAAVEDCCIQLVKQQGRDFERCCTELRLLLSLFYLRAEVFSNPVKGCEKVGQMINYLRANYYRPELSIGKLAEKFNCSPNYIQRIFKASTGENPKQCLLRIRMSAALGFLKEGNYLVKEVATLCGFADAHYFANVFREYHRCSPTYVLKNGSPGKNA